MEGKYFGSQRDKVGVKVGTNVGVNVFDTVAVNVLDGVGADVLVITTTVGVDVVVLATVAVELGVAVRVADGRMIVLVAIGVFVKVAIHTYAPAPQAADPLCK